jgi:hypothetical protein
MAEDKEYHNSFVKACHAIKDEREFEDYNEKLFKKICVYIGKIESALAPIKRSSLDINYCEVII